LNRFQNNNQIVNVTERRREDQFLKYGFTIYLLAASSLAALSACDDRTGSKDKTQTARPIPAVVVAPVTSKPVAASADFVGQAKAFQLVEIRARITGFLLERAFKEGSEVKKSDTLFKIDPAQYNAARDAAAAKVAGRKATKFEAESQLARFVPLRKSGTITQAKLEEAKARVELVRAELTAAEAELKRVELDVGYTVIASPIDGRIGGSTVDVGNLIGPNNDVLATIVSLDPIHVTFSISERSYLNYAQARMRGETTGMTPKIRLANDQIYPHDGKVDFVDNRVDPSTGTIRVRASFPNPDSLILPGQFLNVTLVSSDPEEQVVIPQASVQANQAGPFVLIVNNDNIVEVRPVKTGQLVGSKIAVSEGLEVGETIIVEGIQKVRPNAKVNPVMKSATR
jgi:membrane fusion protein (multidrug efflux system)